MRIKLPLTGTVTEIEPFIAGDPNDPISPVNIDLGNVSWTLIGIDLDAEEMEIEIVPKLETKYATGELDDRGQPKKAMRPTTQKERDALIEHARNFSLERMSKEALYALSGSPRLKNPFKEKV